MKYVQFKDSTETLIVAEFACPQDPDQYPNQAAIDETHPLYVAFVEQTSGAVAEAKRKRGELLVGSDWTTGNDSPLSAAKQDEWKIYRQTLRDITAQSGYPDTIIWPTQPA